MKDTWRWLVSTQNVLSVIRNCVDCLWSVTASIIIRVMFVSVDIHTRGVLKKRFENLSEPQKSDVGRAPFERVTDFCAPCEMRSESHWTWNVCIYVRDANTERSCHAYNSCSGYFILTFGRNLCCHFIRSSTSPVLCLSVRPSTPSGHLCCPFPFPVVTFLRILTNFDIRGPYKNVRTRVWATFVAGNPNSKLFIDLVTCVK
jgi:hypothetical protein